jgi:hypothetical protein
MLNNYAQDWHTHYHNDEANWSQYADKYRDQYRRDSLDKLRQAAASNRDDIDPHKAAANLQTVRQHITDQLAADPARVTLAWDAMRPLVDTGTPIQMLARKAHTIHDLGALAIYGPNILAAHHKANPSAEDTIGQALAGQPTPTDAETALDRAILAEAPRFGIDTQPVNDARAEITMRSIWAALTAGQGAYIQPDDLASVAAIDSGLYQAVRGVMTAMTGHDGLSSLEQAIAVKMATAPIAQSADEGGNTAA